MKNRFIKLFMLVSACTLSSCVEEMGKTEFEKNIQRHSTETINNVWYAGSANGYDFFIHNTALSCKKVKLKEKEITLSDRFPLTDDKKRWTLIKADTDLFMLKNSMKSIDGHAGFQIIPTPAAPTPAGQPPLQTAQ